MDLREKASQLPASPGVYLYKDAHGEVLYVGKAKSLKKRVSNYARGVGHTSRIARMIAETAAQSFFQLKLSAWVTPLLSNSLPES